MAKLTVRDPYGREFEIHPSARPYWEHREGHTILDEPTSEAPQSPPAESGAPTPNRRAARAAQEVKEQPGG